MARPDTPVRSLATEDNLMPTSSRTFSIAWISRARSRTIVDLFRVRSCDCRTGSGGTNDARISPCAANCASQTAFDTSVSRPGRLRTSRALTRVTGSTSSNR